MSSSTRETARSPPSLRRGTLNPLLLCLPLLLALAFPARAETACRTATGTRDLWLEIDEASVCRVVAFRQVPHTGLWFQLQAYLADGQTPETQLVDGRLELGGPSNAGAGILILTAAHGEPLIPLAGWSGSNAVIDEPRLIHTVAGPLVLVPMAATVTAHPADDAIFRQKGKRWHQVNTTAWANHVTAPHGLLQRSGNAMDWPTLRAFGAWWRDGDPNCCPTGGSYIAQLALKGTTLRLVALRTSRHHLPFP